MGVTIKDIAKKANVSITTVSRVINNKPDVSSKTRKEIMKVIHKMGYKPNGIARGLVLNKTYTIGLIIPDISNPFFPEVARGVENKARQLGYSVIFCNTNNDNQIEREAIDVLKRKQVDGIILSLGLDNEKLLEELIEEKMPVVQLDRGIAGSPFPVVALNDLKSSYLATKYLVDLGHTELAHITGDLRAQTACDRLIGFKKVINEFNLNLQDDWIQEGSYNRASGYRSMKALLALKNKPSAVFAANDLMAIGAYEAIFEAGLSIPENISVIGHDGIDIASIIRPGLTTMNLSKKKFGEMAAEMLIEGIQDSNLYNVQNIKLETELVVRGSTKEVI